MKWPWHSVKHADNIGTDHVFKVFNLSSAVTLFTPRISGGPCSKAPTSPDVSIRGLLPFLKYNQNGIITCNPCSEGQRRHQANQGRCQGALSPYQSGEICSSLGWRSQGVELNLPTYIIMLVYSWKTLERLNIWAVRWENVLSLSQLKGLDASCG